MKYILISLLVFLTSFTLKAQEEKMNSVKTIIEVVKKQFAPDKRTAIFEVTVTEADGIFTLTGETNIPAAKKNLSDKLKSLNFSFKNEMQILPSKNLEDHIYGIVNISVANIRTNPSDEAELSSQTLLGTVVKIYKKIPGYFLIQTPDDYIGWIDNDVIITLNKTQLDEWIQSEKIIFTKEFGFSYINPDENSERVSDFVAGDILTVQGEENNFYKVVYPDGRIAFVDKNYCEKFNEWIKKPLPTGESIIKTSKSLMGIPYLWGGTSIKGMDCSGFTKMIYFLNGIILPRDASQQVNTGILVDTKNGFQNLIAGDLLFFGKHETDSTKEKITHVAIYLGDLRFIHASGRIKINSLDRNAPDYSDYRFTHFIRAKRILTSIGKNGVISVSKNKYYLGEM